MRKKRAVRALRPPLPRLAERRAVVGLTQEELAAKVGLTQGMISQLENGHSDYTGNTLELLAKALDCEPADLLDKRTVMPADLGAVWKVLDPGEREQAIRMMKAIKRPAGE